MKQIIQRHTGRKYLPDYSGQRTARDAHIKCEDKERVEDGIDNRSR